MAEDPIVGEPTGGAIANAEALLRNSGDRPVSIERDQLQTLVDALRPHGPLAATVSEIHSVRDMLEHILQNPDDPTLPIDELDELDDQTVTLARGDIWPILSLLMLGPRSDDEAIVQSDRERACGILSDWGGMFNAQLVSDTMRGLRDSEQGFAGDLVRAFRDHRISGLATMAPPSEDRQEP